MEKIRQHIIESKPFQGIISRVQKLVGGESMTVHGVAGSLMAFVAAAVFERCRSQVLLVASDTDRAEKLRDDCALLLGEANIRYYGERPTHHAQMLDMTSSIAHIETLQALSSGLDMVVIASPKALSAKVPVLEEFSRNVIELRVNSEYNFTKLIDTLAGSGFERKDFVEGYGDFSVRGGILDVFPYIGENPIRIEFWGDGIESIREFDILSQRSIRELQSATIIADISGEGTASVFDYLKPDAVVILDEPELLRREIEELLSEGVEQIFDWQFVESRVEGFSRIIHSTIRSSTSSVAFDFVSTRQPSFNGSIKTLIQEINKQTGQGLHIYLTCDTKEEAGRLQELIDEELSANPRPLPFTIIPETLHSGFIFPSAGLTVFTEHEIFGRLKRRGTAKRRRFKGFTQRELQQLKRGDYVAHADYGIGQFAGLQKISVQRAEQEVMKVLYLENDVLYVNLNSIDRVQKYASREGHVPKLTKLGAPDWERLKSKAKRRIKDIARELIRLYARRKHEKGFNFSPDSHWQKEMEASFMYEDTPDQANATDDVKKDMEVESPMDRLICGDVGFGKTEVAVRGAFKAVLDGKQVAVLVPTTILAQQHYNTFKDRLGRYPVQIEFISRFKTRKEQAHVLQGLKSGTIDVIIGTHRLLSKDVEFKDLGLLVIDEEHRFGVTAKEKLRQLKATVDTLILTATPIPRTLYFSLMGARDISLINTPPRNRLPIVTEIAEFDWKLIREAILKELHRGGQVYFIHDRVQRIEEMQSLLKEHVPEARYAIAHGQIHGHQLEKVMVDFLEKKFDVLICTKIIESGIDIPNVNTIVINRADRFGLAELYQLRGRVGRSNVQAYAYLLTPPISVLPKDAIRRLQAIEEFTELGSGFSLAMRDLEIRGAGNLLGAEQSGFIMEMGYEMYERIVREAVEELRQEEFRDVPVRASTGASTADFRTIVEAGVDAYIPDFYIESDTERLEIYRRLSGVHNIEPVDELRGELRDRFGDYPPEVENLFLLVELRLLASGLDLIKLTLSEGGISLAFPGPEHSSFYDQSNGETSKFQKILDAVTALAEGAFQLKQGKKNLTLIVEEKILPNSKERLLGVKEFLTRLVQSV